MVYRVWPSSRQRRGNSPATDRPSARAWGRKRRHAADATAEIDSTCLVIRNDADMKKPGSPEASRALSECVVRFREGNGACVHRLEMPGGGPFCVARCRVCFDHSLSQVSLLGRNLITVFLCVNNLEHFFSPRASAPVAATAMAEPATCRDRRGRTCARRSHAFRKCLVSSCLRNTASRAGCDRRARRAGRERHNGSRMGRVAGCVRHAKKSPCLRVAQARLRGFARTGGGVRHDHARPPCVGDGRTAPSTKARGVLHASMPKRRSPLAGERDVASERHPAGSARQNVDRKKRRRPRSSAAFRKYIVSSPLSGRLRAARRSRRARAVR